MRNCTCGHNSNVHDTSLGCTAYINPDMDYCPCSKFVDGEHYKRQQQREAKKLQKETGMKYTEALRKIREDWANA